MHFLQFFLFWDKQSISHICFNNNASRINCDLQASFDNEMFELKKTLKLCSSNAT